MGLENVFVTPHATLRASEIFRVDHGPKSRQIVHDYMKKAHYVSEIVGEDGKVDRLFAYRRIALIVDRYHDVVITIYERTNVEAELREKVRELLFDHLEELHSQEQGYEEDILQASIAHEITLGLEAAGVDELEPWIRLSAKEVRDTENRLHEYRLERSKVAKGVVAYL